MPPSMPRQDITAALGASPPCRISSQPISFFPLGLENLFGAADQVALQFLFIGEVLFGHPALAFLADLPKALVTLVAADVDVFRWKELGDFGEDLVDELEGLFIARTEGVIDLGIETR